MKRVFFFPDMATCGSTDVHLKKKTSRKRKTREEYFPFTPESNSRGKTTQGHGFPGNWDVLEAAAHPPQTGRAPGAAPGMQEGSLQGEPGKGHARRAPGALTARGRIAAAASAWC